MVIQKDVSQNNLGCFVLHISLPCFSRQGPLWGFPRFLDVVTPLGPGKPQGNVIENGTATLSQLKGCETTLNWVNGWMELPLRHYGMRRVGRTWIHCHLPIEASTGSQQIFPVPVRDSKLDKLY